MSRVERDNSIRRNRRKDSDISEERVKGKGQTPGRSASDFWRVTTVSGKSSQGLAVVTFGILLLSPDTL